MQEADLLLFANFIKSEICLNSNISRLSNKKKLIRKQGKLHIRTIFNKKIHQNFQY